ncbi:serine/arginine-rich splicing factor 5-like isoform X2 [Anneissia japonica]|uniref:serine/arginine-rich splicing factor 5-like isoform X2 n=1 Tax=Anneissia japonica TaxID=1529436 RepID=UPI0014258119|nr:serine/arginine-rich splicing factor 5-like isoform X2 [Anneissia japonica]
MNRGGYSGGPGGHHYGGMGYNGGYGMGPGPGPMHNYPSGGGMMGGGGGGGGGGANLNNITNSNDPKSKASRVFLGNLNTGFVKRPEVEQVFRKYGQILGISLHNGFGFIQFSNEHSAKSAVMEEQGRVMAYQPLDLRIASDPDKNRPKGFKRVQGDCFGMEHASAPSVSPQAMGNGIGRLGGMMGALQNIIDRNSPGNLTNSTHPNDLASRLFIGNLNTGLVTRQNIEHIFSQYGKITGISLHKGFGFVQFTKGDDAMAAKQKEHGRILASQPLDLHIANEPDRERPKGFKRVQDEAKYTGYVDPTLLPIHPTSGPPAKRKKEEGDEPDDWQCSICDEITPTAWQLIKHAATIHELVIYRDNKAMQAMQTS